MGIITLVGELYGNYAADLPSLRFRVLSPPAAQRAAETPRTAAGERRRALQAADGWGVAGGGG